MIREDFPLFLKKLGLNNRGAEIGVDTGVFSTVLISAGFDLFFSIDNWSSDILDTVEEDGRPSTKPAEDNYRLARQRLSFFGERSKILRKTSEEAAYMFENHYFDFVYLDADHRYEEILKDLHLWYPKIRPGGILAGHDYKDETIYWEKTNLRSYFGVKRAVDEFFKDRKLEVNITDEPSWKSWYVHKPKENADT